MPSLQPSVGVEVEVEALALPVGSDHYPTLHGPADLASQASDTAGLAAGLGIFCHLQPPAPAAQCLCISTYEKRCALEIA